MQLPIVINDKEYEVIGTVSFDGKKYMAYEDEETIYINAYEIEDEKLSLLDITESEKERVIKELGLWEVMQ